MRMTIVPSERRIDFNLEREAHLRSRKQSLLPAVTNEPALSAPTTPARSQLSSAPATPRAASVPATPARSSSATSSPRVASANSSTSRRISALLVATPRSALKSDSSDDRIAVVDFEEDDNSSEDESLHDIEAILESPNIAAEDEAAEAYEDADELAMAASIPLPDSPLVNSFSFVQASGSSLTAFLIL
jgi:hypothetical protein